LSISPTRSRYSQPEHNVFLKMQLADPLLSHGTAKPSPVKWPEESEALPLEEDLAGVESTMEGDGTYKHGARTEVETETKNDHDKGTGQRS
jgi:hypothetical protein